MVKGIQEEFNEISYTVLNINHKDSKKILQKMETGINVQIALDNDQNIPFIAPDVFDKAKYFNKLFVYGPSGCGKSRIIFEIIRDKMATISSSRPSSTEKIEKIIIINPRQTIGKESGRSSIIELVSKLGSQDIIVWDNFPDDLVKKDVDNVKKYSS